MKNQKNSLTGPYPKPGPIGGALIREVIAFLRDQGCQLPLSSHILIAVSGGCDSIALAHILIHYGRKIATKTRISLLHVNHGWRGVESDGDELFVKNLGQAWGVPVIIHRLEPIPHQKGHNPSWEDVARRARKTIFSQEAKKAGAVVFTAHHSDDLAETLLWRLFTGAAKTHGGGIAFQYEKEIRPFLRVRKSKMKHYLEEVKQGWREDLTNFSGRFLRARMRQRLMPEIEILFPQAVSHLIELALKAQKQAASSFGSGSGNRLDSGQNFHLDLSVKLEDHLARACLPYDILFQAAGLNARRPHLEAIAKKVNARQDWHGEIHLPGGWKLIKEKQKRFSGKNQAVPERGNQQKLGSYSERWILERI